MNNSSFKTSIGLSYPPLTASLLSASGRGGVSSRMMIESSEGGDA